MTLSKVRVSLSWLAVSASLLFLFLGGALFGAAAQSDEGAGVVVSGQATSADLGLPIYPGAKPFKEANNDSDSGRVGIWGVGFGFKVAAMKMESNDSVAKVGEFYRKALSKYGQVLDCTNGGQGQDDSPKALTCEGDKPGKSGGMLFKSGTKKHFHLVAVDPQGQGSTFSLVYISIKGD